jgi:F-type H+-transporting ATPase subunit epsilon
MASTIHVDIVSAEAEIYSGDAEMLIASAEAGDVGIAPGHAPFVSRIRPGEVTVKVPGQGVELIYVSGGVLEVQPHVVTVLADTAVRAADLDEAEAIRAKERAEELLKDKQDSIEYAQAQAELAEAVAQLQVIRKLKRGS